MNLHRQFVALLGTVMLAGIGHFDGNVGIFEEHYTLGGKPAIDRYTWTKYGKDSKVAAHFEETISIDDGKTWELMFVNDLVRAV